MIHRIGGVEFDTTLHELRGPGGTLALRAQVYELLLYLVNRRNRVVRRHELKATLWGGARVGRASLPQCMKLLRQALQAAGGEGDVIRTVYGKGYVLGAEKEHDREERTIACSAGFVGRRREMETIEILLHTSGHGDGGGLVFLVGEPGIGKSRTVEEVVRLAPGFAAVAWLGRCPESEQSPPFWPWIEIIRSDAARRVISALRRLAGADAAEIVRLAPELAAVIGVEPTSSAFVEPETERLRLYDALARYFSRLASEQALVLALDDLHRADRATLALLCYLAPRLRLTRILLIGTYREPDLQRVEWRAAAITEATRAAAARVLTLEGLSREEVATFLGQRMGAPLERQIVDALHEKSGGNPFFLSQLAPLLETGAGRRFLSGRMDDRPNLLPRNVRDAIAMQVAGLSAACREALSAASIVGRSFAVSDIAAISASPVDTARAQLEEARRVGVVQPLGSGDDGYRFSHDLVRSLLYDAMPAGERARRHLRVARAIEGRATGDERERIDRLAYHYRHAVGAGGGVAEAIDYAMRAAEGAMEKLAHEQAVEHLQAALALSMRRPERDARRRCDLLLALGEAQMRAGAREEARLTFTEAPELARRIRSAERLARAALGLAPDLLAFEIGFDRHRVGLIEEALRRMGDSVHPLRARLLAQLSLSRVWSVEQNHRRDLARQTVSVARRAGDPATLAFALCARHATIMGARHLERRRAIVKEIGRLAERTHDGGLALLHHVFQIRVLLEVGDLAAAARELSAYERVVDEQCLTHAAWYSDQFHAMRALLAGDFQTVSERCEKLLAAAERLQEGTARQSYVSIDCLRRRYCGNVEESVAIIEGVLRRAPELRSLRCALAQICCEAGRLERGRELYEELVIDVRNLPEDEVWGNSIATLGEACCELGGEKHAALFYELTAPAEERFFVLHYGMAILTSVARVRGRLATLLGEWEAAAAHFRAAIEREQALGSPLLVAHSELDFARMLLARGRSRDRARARRLARSAYEKARSLGLRRIEREARGLG